MSPRGDGGSGGTSVLGSVCTRIGLQIWTDLSSSNPIIPDPSGNVSR